MRKASFYDIKSDARDSMKGHIGEVILAGLIMPLAFSLIFNFFNGIFEFIHWSIPIFISSFTSAFSSYIVYRMLIKISRYKSDKIFNDFFGTKKGIFSSLAWGLISLLSLVVYIIIFWEYIVFFWEAFDLVQTTEYLENPEILELFINNYIFPELSTLAIIIAIVYSFIIIILSIRFSFALHIVADTNVNILEALKKSWRITKGNWWRVFFFPLSFILWAFAVTITLGLAIVYVVPYKAVSHASLYNHLLKEQGINFDDGVKREVETVEDENALDNDEKQFDKEDPFSDYYKSQLKTI